MYLDNVLKDTFEIAYYASHVNVTVCKCTVMCIVYVCMQLRRRVIYTYLLMDGCCVPTDGYHAPAPVAGEGGSVTRRGGTSRIDTTVNSGTEYAGSKSAKTARLRIQRGGINREGIY